MEARNLNVRAEDGGCAHGDTLGEPTVDLHMHIVPGVDDGPCSLEESLQMLSLAEQ